MNYDNWLSTEPDNRDDDPGPDGDECPCCHAPAGEPCAKDCRLILIVLDDEDVPLRRSA